MTSAVADTYTVGSGQPVYAGCVPPNLFPTWRQSMSVGQFKELPGTACAGYTHSLGAVTAAIRDAYSGVFVDEDRNLVIINGGGHNDSNDNVALKLSLNQNTPAMSTLCEPSPVSERLGTVWDGTLPNQKRNACHTYDSGVYVPSLGYLWFFSRSPAPNGGAITGSDIIFTMSTAGAWVQSNAAAFLGNTQMTALICKDASNNVYGYKNGTSIIQKFDTVTKTATTAASNALIGGNGFGVLVYDSLRNRLVRIGDLGSAKFTTIDLPGGTVTDVSGSLSGSGSVVSNLNTLISLGDQFPGACYDQWGDRYIVPTGLSGGSYWTVHPTTWAVTLVTPTLASGSATVPARGTAACGAIKVLPALKGAVFIPNGTNNAYFLALSN